MLACLTKEKFYDEAMKKDNLIVIGLGKKLLEFQEFFSDTLLPDKNIILIDNDITKLESTVSLFGKNYKVKPFDYLFELSPEKSLIIITCYRTDDIDSILDKLRSDSYTQRYCTVCMRLFERSGAEDFALSKEVPDSIKLTDTQVIPKMIHYCWFGGKPLPDKYKYWIDSWTKFCPDYEIIQWDESNYDLTKNAYMRQAYERGIWGFVPDYARLDIILENGGIYLDTDVEIVRNFDDLLFQDGFVGFEGGDYVNLGQGFGAVKGHPLIREMRDDYNSKKFVNEDGTLNLVASPVYQTMLLNKHGLICDGEYQVIDGITVFPEKMFSGKNIHTMCVRLKDYTHSIHHFDGSWASDEARKTNEWYQKMFSSENR